MTGSQPTTRPVPVTPLCGADGTSRLPVPRAAAEGTPATSGLAWVVRSVTHVPGVLHLRDGRLRFVSTRGVLFDDTPQALALTTARTARGGFRITVGGERLRLHVVRFPGAVDVAGWLREREELGELSTLGEAAAGARWREAVAAQLPDPGRGPVELRLRGWRSARSRRACGAPARSY